MIKCAVPGARWCVCGVFVWCCVCGGRVWTVCACVFADVYDMCDVRLQTYLDVFLKLIDGHQQTTTLANVQKKKNTNKTTCAKHVENKRTLT